MPNQDSLREIATRACCDALQGKSQELAQDIAHRMEVAMASQPGQREHTRQLRNGAVLIAASRTQTEILETLLAASSAITPACGLLILRGTQATGWNCHGLTSLDNFKRATMDCSRGIAAKAINSCTATLAQISEIDPAFIAKLGLKNSAPVLLVPVLLKERVAALLIAVSGHSNDLEGLELLVQVAQLNLDLVAYRKASPQPVVAEPTRQAIPHPQPPAAAPPQPAPVPQKPEQVYPPTPPVIVPAAAAVAVPAQQAVPEPVYAASASDIAVVVPPTVVAPPTVEAQLAAPAVPEAVAAPQPIAPLLDPSHEKARRFAKLLVEEIKLYNQTKVAEGRARCDLYSRLREDIEKSRAAYHKRYGESVRDVDYFTQELMRILAGNNPAVMGAGFPG